MHKQSTNKCISTLTSFLHLFIFFLICQSVAIAASSWINYGNFHIFLVRCTCTSIVTVSFHFLAITRWKNKVIDLETIQERKKTSSQLKQSCWMNDNACISLTPNNWWIRFHFTRILSSTFHHLSKFMCNFQIDYFDTKFMWYFLFVATLRVFPNIWFDSYCFKFYSNR